MSYQPFDRNPSGIVFFGTNATDGVYDSNASFTIDGTSLLATNLKISNGGSIGSVGDSDAISIASNGDVTLSQDVSIGGDLVVNGTTTTVHSTTVEIYDPIFTIGSGAPTVDDNKDRGVAFNYYSGSAKKGFFGYDDSTGKFTFIPDATIAGEVVSGSVGTILANFEGALTGNADTATALETERDFSITGQVTATAVGFDGTGNVALSATLSTTAITSQTALTSVDGTNDFLLIYDDSAGTYKKINRTNFVSGLGSMSSFTISDGTSTQTIQDSDTLLFNSGADIFFEVSATDQVDAFINAGAITGTELNSSVAGNGLTGGGGSALAVGAGNGITVNANDVALATSTAGNGLTYTAGVLAVGAGSLIDVTSTTVDVDLTEAAAATIADGDYLIFLDGGSTGTESKGSTADLATLLAGTITTTGLDSNGSTLEVQVDDSSIELDGSGNVSIKDGGVTEAMISRSVAAVTLAGTITSDINLVTTGASNLSLTLPAVASGKMVIVKKIDSGAGTVTVVRGGSSTIDGATQKILYAQYESMTFVSNGTNWYIV